MPIWSQVSTMRMPGASPRTRTWPTCAGSSSVRAHTSIQRRPGAPVAKILWPDSVQPSGVRRIIVAGMPPRVGEPSSGSTRSALISAPCSTASVATRARTCSGHRPVRFNAGLLEQLHREDQPGGGAAFREDAEHARCIAQAAHRRRRNVWVRSAPATCLAQPGDVVGRKARFAVMAGGIGRECVPQPRRWRHRRPRMARRGSSVRYANRGREFAGIGSLQIPVGLSAMQFEARRRTT